MGYGSFGKVYAHPRIPCADETVDQIKGLSEASKVFVGDRDSAEEEYQVVARLKRAFSNTDFDQLQQYCILPIKQCMVNPDYVNVTEPYTTEHWRKGAAGKLDAFIFTSTAGLPKDEETHMITFPLGGENASNAMKKGGTFGLFVQNVRKILNLFKGIQLLQKYNFIHGDLKGGNCIESENSFKIIDMADVCDISEIIDAKAMPTAFMYYTWPSVCIYTALFDTDRPDYHNLDSFTKKGVSALYFQQTDYNHTALEYMKSFFAKGFLFSEQNGVSPDDEKRVRELGIQIAQQKMLNYGGKSATEEGEANFYDIFRYETFEQKLKAAETNEIDASLQYLATTFKNVPVADVKIEVFKRTDIYSLGMLLVEALGCLHGTKKMYYSNDQIKFLLKIYDIVQKCCLFNGLPHVDINTLVSLLLDALNQVGIASKSRRDKLHRNLEG
jgi:hypothetical protein